MANVNVDFNKIIGKIKPMHAVGQPPYGGKFLGFDFSYIDYLTEAKIPYSRLHDVGGPFGGNRFVDIPNIFRDFDADEFNPDSYDFTFTDLLIKEMIERGVKPYFRLGVTIENQANIKAYRIFPPKDYEKWARICEHIVKHYNYGWADGFNYGIEYWEIWNEPENGVKGFNQMWTGTDEEYFRLYDVTAKHLKSVFGNEIKVGGYGACGFYGIYYHPEKYQVNVVKREKDDRYQKDTYRVQFFLDFLKYISENKSPLDFFSCHSYADVEKTVVMNNFASRELERFGYGNVEIHLNEWNNAFGKEFHGTSYSCSAVGAMMCAMQCRTKASMLMYYDARLNISTYAGFFNPFTLKPWGAYYSFKAFGELYALNNQASVSVGGRNTQNLYTTGARAGDKKALYIVNYSNKQKKVTTNLGQEFNVYLIDAKHAIEKTKNLATEFVLKPYQSVLIKNY